MTISRTKQSKSTTATDVVEQLAQIEQSLNLADGMTLAEREGQRSLARNVPDKAIELVADVATQNGGSVAGIPFDAETATATLADVASAQKIVDAAEGLARRVSDDAIQRRAAVANQVFAIYSAMGRLVRTTKGKPLRQKYEEMQRLVRQPRRKAAEADTTQTTTPATTASAAGASEAAPQQAPAAATTQQASTTTTATH